MLAVDETLNSPREMETGIAWFLWLDDERYPPECLSHPTPRIAPEWRIARNVADAKWMVERLGIPIYMSLDHDLGDRKFTGMDFVRWLCDHIMENNIRVPEGFSYRIHSMNPVGAENMERYLKNFFEDWYLPMEGKGGV